MTGYRVCLLSHVDNHEVYDFPVPSGLSYWAARQVLIDAHKALKPCLDLPHFPLYLHIEAVR